MSLRQSMPSRESRLEGMEAHHDYSPCQRQFLQSQSKDDVDVVGEWEVVAKEMVEGLGLGLRSSSSASSGGVDHI